MKIEIITLFYNDEFLAPFFFKHYSWADNIIAMVDIASTDRTLEIAREYPNVTPVEFEFTDGMDDIDKMEFQTQAYLNSDADWIFILDSDEFIFTIPFDFGVRNFLAETHLSDVVVAKLFQVFRHRTDKDLDVNVPVWEQRCHGDPNTYTGLNKEFNKPCVIRGGKSVAIGGGCHYLYVNAKFIIGGNNLYGAHWVMADPCFCVDRRLRAKERQSKRNLDLKLSVQHHHVTRESILAECEAHLDDPEIF